MLTVHNDCLGLTWERMLWANKLRCFKVQCKNTGPKHSIFFLLPHSIVFFPIVHSTRTIPWGYVCVCVCAAAPIEMKWYLYFFRSNTKKKTFYMKFAVSLSHNRLHEWRQNKTGPHRIWMVWFQKSTVLTLAFDYFYFCEGRKKKYLFEKYFAQFVFSAVFHHIPMMLSHTHSLPHEIEMNKVNISEAKNKRYTGKWWFVFFFHLWLRCFDQVSPTCSLNCFDNEYCIFRALKQSKWNKKSKRMRKKVNVYLGGMSHHLQMESNKYRFRSNHQNIAQFVFNQNGFQIKPNSTWIHVSMNFQPANRANIFQFNLPKVRYWIYEIIFGVLR